jgi:hypothetical protein
MPTRKHVTDDEIRAYLLANPEIKVREACETLRVHSRRLSPIRNAIMAEGIKAVQNAMPTITGVTANEPKDIDEIKRRAIYDFKQRNNLEDRKLNQTIRIPFGPACIVFTGDVHFGNVGTDVARVFAEHDLIKSMPNTYLISMGDLLDNFIIGNLRGVHAKSRSSISDQWALAEVLLRSMEDKLIGVVGGNHEAWSNLLSNVDVLSKIVPKGPLYDSDEIRVTLKVGPHEYRVRARHKWKGYSMFNPTHGQEKSEKFDARGFDIFIGAHTHQGSMAREFITGDGERKLAIQTGAYKMFDEYARTEGFPGNDGSTASAIILFEDGGWMTTSSLDHAAKVMRAFKK